jgi:hypothetical protein
MVEVKNGMNWEIGSLQKNTGLTRNKNFRKKMKILRVVTSFIKLQSELRIQDEGSYLERQVIMWRLKGVSNRLLLFICLFTFMN